MLTELFVRPFGASQVSEYFHHWQRQHSGDGGWSAQRYIAFIDRTAGLKELASTPFVLRAMADALPRLDKPTAEGRKRQSPCLACTGAL